MQASILSMSFMMTALSIEQKISQKEFSMNSISRFSPMLPTLQRSLNTTLLAVTCKQIPLVIIQRRFASSERAARSTESTEIQTSNPLDLDSSRMRHIGFRVIPQGTIGILEKFGRFSKTLEPGLHFLVPVMHCIRYAFPVKRVSFSVTPQNAFTKDNIKVTLGGDIIVRITDPKAAAYGADSPFSLATIYAQAAMRNAVGELTLDELLNKRESINTKVLEAVNNHTKQYGLECLGYEIKGLKVPPHIEDEMARQVASERKRRETVLTSEGQKTAAINEAEGLKKAAELSSEGQKAAQINAAQGNAEQRRIEAIAEAEALNVVGKALRENPEAASMRVTSEALRTWSGMLGKSNTIVTSAGASPVEALLSQALATYSRSQAELKATFNAGASPSQNSAGIKK
jgi:regulator of protease activity HflC (stomatin/prohibitin superfamily)